MWNAFVCHSKKPKGIGVVIIKKKVTSFILAMLVFTSVLPAQAVSNSSVIDVDNGRFVSADMILEQEAIDSYFSARDYAGKLVTGTHNTVCKKEDDANNASMDAMLRVQSLLDFWSKEDVEVVSTSSSNEILSAKKISKDTTGAVVYEWTWVDYIDSGCGVVDRMGFGTLHDMTLMTKREGLCSVVRDSYEELDVSGYASADYDRASFTIATADVDTESAYRRAVSKELERNSTSPSLLAATRSGLMSAPIECIKYADNWVEHDISSNGGLVPVYNSTFGYFGGNDCCNFVSQCLYAGGVSMDTSGGWYHAMDGNKYHSGAAWKSVSNFRDYWVYSRGVSVASSAYSNILPGNPVYWIASEDHPGSDTYTHNHVAICVGYNSAGNPIINGHTRNVYHEKLSTTAYKHTLLFNTSNPFIVAPQSATTVTLQGLPNLYLSANKGEWFKFVAPSSGYYTVYTSGTTDTYGYLYQGQNASGSSGGTIYLKELAHNGNAWGGINCRIGSVLEAGKTYYIMICGETSTTCGGFNLNVQIG